MIGRGVAADIPLVSTDQLSDYGALTGYKVAVARPTSRYAQDAFPGPRPDASLAAIQNIGNITLRLVVAQVPPPQQEVWRRRLVSHFTVLPVGAANLAPAGNSG